MSALDALLAARAMSKDAPVPASAVRHIALAQDPLVISVLRLGGERFRPLALAMSSPSAPLPHVIAVLDTQDSGYYLRAAHRIASALSLRLGEGRQVVVPDAATLSALSMVGRAMVTLAGAYGSRRHSLAQREAEMPTSAREVVHAGGALLMMLEDLARTPGSSVVVPAATALSSLYAFAPSPNGATAVDLRSQLAQLAAPGDAFAAAGAARRGGQMLDPVTKTMTSAALSVGPNLHPATEEEMTLSDTDRRNLYGLPTHVRRAFAQRSLVEAVGQEYAGARAEGDEDYASYEKVVSTFSALVTAHAGVAHEAVHTALARIRTWPVAPSAGKRLETGMAEMGRTIVAINEITEQAKQCAKDPQCIQAGEAGAHCGHRRGHRLAESTRAAAASLAARERAAESAAHQGVFDDAYRAAEAVLAARAARATVDRAQVTSERAGAQHAFMVVAVGDEVFFEDGEELVFGYGRGHATWKVGEVDINEEGQVVLELSTTKAKRELVMASPHQVITLVRAPGGGGAGALPQQVPWTHASHGEQVEGGAQAGGEEAQSGASARDHLGGFSVEAGLDV